MAPFPNLGMVSSIGILIGLAISIYSFHNQLIELVFGYVALSVLLMYWYRWRFGWWIVLGVTSIGIGVFWSDILISRNIEQDLGYLSTTAYVHDVEKREQSNRIYLTAEYIPGTILAFSDQSHIQPGDTITIEGMIQKPEPFESFDWPRYLEEQGVYYVSFNPYIEVHSQGPQSSFGALINGFRRSTSDRIFQDFPRDVASIVSAITIGDRGRLNEDVAQAFRKTGLSHFLAVSGLHMGILAAGIFFILIFLGLHRTQATFAAMGIIGVYIFVAGASASAVRAALMGMGILAAFALSKKIRYERLFMATLTLLAFLNPLQIRYDIGFILSYAAIAGIIFITPIIQYVLRNIPDTFRLRSVFSISLAVQISLIPLLIIFFGSLAIIAPVINILVAGYLPIILSLSLLYVIVSWIEPLSHIFSVITWMSIKPLLVFVEGVASLPYIYFENIQPQYSVIFMYYALLACGVLLWRKYYHMHLTPYKRSLKQI